MAKHLNKQQLKAERIMRWAVVYAVVVCSFVMVKYRSSAPARVTARPSQALRNQIINLRPMAATLLPPSLEEVVKKVEAPVSIQRGIAAPTAPLSIKKIAAAIAPKKVLHKKRHSRKSVRIAKKKVVAPKVVEAEVDLSFLDAEFDVADDQPTFNVVTPLDQIADAGFAEADLELATLPTQTRNAEVNIPREGRITEVVAVYQHEDFSRIQKSLDHLEETSIALDEFLETEAPTAEAAATIPAPEAKTVGTAPVAQKSFATLGQEKTMEVVEILPTPKGPVAEVSTAVAALAEKFSTGLISSVPVAAANVSAPIAAARKARDVEEAVETLEEEVTTHGQAIAPGDHVVTHQEAPTPAPTYEALPTSTKEVIARGSAPGEPSLSMPSKTVLAMPAPIPVPVPTKKAAPTPGPTISAPTKSGTTVVANRQQEQQFADAEGGLLLGRIEPDTALADWLASMKGHVELYMHPVESADPQDTIFVDYQYPSEDFSVDLRGLNGKYRLVAGIFSPKSTTAIAQVSYGKPITAASYKERVGFPLTKAMVDRAVTNAPAARTDGQVFYATLFEGASGNHRQPKPIAEGKLRVIGFPEWGTMKSDKEGNVRIPKVPGRSELLVEVTATGYFPTYRTIPTFGTNVYAPIYLLSRDKVDAITRYFTKHPQKEKAGVVMGRIFDPATRAPKKDATVSLSARRGRPLYFSALPDPKLPATTESGLFGFFNVSPTFRTVYRQDKRPLLLNVRPGSGDYVELGRGGKKSLTGKLLDPFSNTLPPAKVTVVGDGKAQFFTDKNGNFKIADIDLPPGVITLEIQAEGYPTTWHSVAWNTREREVTRSIFMMERELLAESAQRVAHVKLDRNLGALVGGADASFFAKGAKCVTVNLFDANGSAIEKTAGPFPLVSAQKNPEAKLCLTKQAPGFAYYNLKPGEYILKWTDAAGQNIRSHVLYVGPNRVSIAVD